MPERKNAKFNCNQGDIIQEFEILTEILTTKTGKEQKPLKEKFKE